MAAPPVASTDTPARYPPPSFIDPEALMQIKSLELRARSVVEGFLTGLHRSPFHGFSVEFTEYRQYVGGDDLRYLDWKLYARSDRYYVKRFEDETNLRCCLLVDNSRSMLYQSLPYTKADYAKTLAASLAYFLMRQRDAIGLLRFSDGVDEFIPPRYRPGQMRRILARLDQPPEGTSTGLLAALAHAAERIRKRGLFLVVSDFLIPLDELENRLGYLRAGGNEVAVFQILDPAERRLGFERPLLLVDAETGREVYIDPVTARPEYQARLERHLAKFDECCAKLGIQLCRLTSEMPLETALFDFLRTRTQASPSRRR